MTVLTRPESSAVLSSDPRRTFTEISEAGDASVLRLQRDAAAAAGLGGPIDWAAEAVHWGAETEAWARSSSSVGAEAASDVVW